MIDFRKKRVVILGGSQGLGFHLARAWLACGAHVTIVARDGNRLAAASDALEKLQLMNGLASARPAAQVTTMTADVTSPDDLQNLFAGLPEIDVLVNSFGRSDRGRAIETSAEAYREAMELNFLAVARCVGEAADALRASRGVVVNIGSLASKIVSPLLGAYPASKFALAAYTAQLRIELASDGVHALLVCPGPIRRDDSGQRYDSQAAGLPEAAKKPGGGVKLKGIDPDWLAERVVDACAHRKAELVVPGRARLLFAIAQLSPSWGDWIVRRMTS